MAGASSKVVRAYDGVDGVVTHKALVEVVMAGEHEVRAPRAKGPLHRLEGAVVPPRRKGRVVHRHHLPAARGPRVGERRLEPRALLAHRAVPQGALAVEDEEAHVADLHLIPQLGHRLHTRAAVHAGAGKVEVC